MAGGGIAVAAVLAVGVVAGSAGVFGLSDDPPRVGKLSPIDSTRTTTVTAPGSDDDAPAGATPGATVGTTPSTTPNPGPGPAPATAGSLPTTTVTTPGFDDHGGDDHDSSGPGSSHSGGDDASRGPGGGSGRDHPEDD
jgi:hypothetical protein